MKNDVKDDKKAIMHDWYKFKKIIIARLMTEEEIGIKVAQDGLIGLKIEFSEYLFEFPHILIPNKNILSVTPALNMERSWYEYEDDLVFA